MITLDMVERCYDAGIIKLIDSPNGDGVVCSIGDNWFYFGGLAAKEMTVEEYQRDIPAEVIVNSIYELLEEFRKTGDVFEYVYFSYEEFLFEKLREVPMDNIVDKDVSDGIVDSALRTIQGVGVHMGSGCYELNSFEIDGEKLNLYCDICKIEDGDGARYAVYYAVEYDDGDNLFHDWGHTEQLDVDELKKVVFEIANTDFSEDILKCMGKGSVEAVIEGAVDRCVVDTVDEVKGQELLK